MAFRKILLEDDPILRKKSKEVVVFDDNLKLLFADMDETMKKADGSGISAVQVGILKRAFIVADRKDKVYCVNPTILKTSGHIKNKVEGCLSLPGKCGLVDRPSVVEAKYQDLDGKWQQRKFTGWIAKAFCHEYDHLEGILYSDRAEKMFNSYEECFKYLEKNKEKK